MLTYNRGQWGNDDSYSDGSWHYIPDRDALLKFEGFEEIPSIRLGIESNCSVDFYYSKETSSNYHMVALLATYERCEIVLLADFPSVLQFAKEVESLIRMSTDRLRYDERKEA